MKFWQSGMAALHLEGITLRTHSILVYTKIRLSMKDMAGQQDGSSVVG